MTTLSHPNIPDCIGIPHKPIADDIPFALNYDEHGCLIGSGYGYFEKSGNSLQTVCLKYNLDSCEDTIYTYSVRITCDDEYITNTGTIKISIDRNGSVVSFSDSNTKFQEFEYGPYDIMKFLNLKYQKGTA
jgi:hypothetical protein